MRISKSLMFPLIVSTALCAFDVVMHALQRLGGYAGGLCTMDSLYGGWIAGTVSLAEHQLCMHPVLGPIIRIAVILILVFAIYAAARSVTDNDREARLGTLLAVGGIGLGWLAPSAAPSVGFLSTTDWFWSITGVTPDLSTPFAVLPAIATGALPVLTITLLMYVMRGVWNTERKGKDMWLLPLAIIALTLYHVTFLPLIAATIFIALAKEIRDSHLHSGKRVINPLFRHSIHFASLIPSLGYLIWLLTLPAYRRMAQFEAPPIAPLDRWVFVLAPALFAFLWTFKHHDRRQIFFRNSRWCLSWLLVAAVMTILLPAAWTTHLTDGLMIPLVLLTLPVWSTLFESLPKITRFLFLTGVLGATPLFLIVNQISLLHRLN